MAHSSYDRMIGVLVATYVVLTPFVWSFLFQAGSVLVRPTDLIAVTLFGLVILANRRLGMPSRVLMCVLLAYLAALALSCIAQGGIMTPVLKAGAVSVAMLALTVGLRRLWVPAWMPLLPLALLVLANPALLVHLAESIERFASGNIRSALFTFWNELFRMNLFGGVGLDVRGQSGRNAFAMGTVAIVLFSLLHVRPGAGRTLLIAVFVGLTVISFSRSGWLALAVLAALNLRSLRAWTMLGAAAAVALFLSADWIEAFDQRFSSNIGRLEDYPYAFEMFAKNLWFGDISIETHGGGAVVHNVPLHLAVNFGLFVGVIALAIFLFCLLTFAWFAARSLLGGDLRDAVLATAAFVCALRMNVSAVDVNIFSMGEMVCFAMVVAGLSASRAATAGALPGRALPA